MLLIYDLLNEYLAYKFLKANHTIEKVAIYDTGLVLVMKSLKEDVMFLK